MNCPWITRFGMVVLCDGRVSCNCGDGLGTRIIGDLRRKTLAEIWDGRRIRKLRKRMGKGTPDRFCWGCVFLEDRPMEAVASFPDVLFFEPIVSCNLRCPQHVCMKLNADPLPYRKKRGWEFEPFVQKIVPFLKHVKEFRFYNYGEPFLNRDLPRMLTAARKANPSLYMLTSTNGMVLSETLAESLVLNQVDYLSVSIDGACQESYETYRRGGSLRHVLENVDRLVELKQRHKSGKPVLHWRYILFRWNDSLEEMKKAVHLAQEHGFDEFTWHVTTEPEGCPSLVYAKGSPQYAKLERDVFKSPYPGTANALDYLEDYR